MVEIRIHANDMHIRFDLGHDPIIRVGKKFVMDTNKPRYVIRIIIATGYGLAEIHLDVNEAKRLLEELEKLVK